MGKKSKRYRSKNKPQYDEEGGVDENELASQKKSMKDAFDACSLDRLCDIYKDWSDVFGTSVDLERASKAYDSLSKTMEEYEKNGDYDLENDGSVLEQKPILVTFLSDFFMHTSQPSIRSYRRGFQKQLNSMGGMEITFIPGRRTKSTFAYTCGFTSVGGSELLLQNIHKSLGKAYAAHLFNKLFQDHKDGHPVGHGHSLYTGNVAFLALAPDDQHEAILLKATRTLSPTRLYGVGGYDILELVPVGYNPDLRPNDSGLFFNPITRQDTIMLGLGADVGGFKSLVGKNCKLEACGWCHVVRDAKQQKPLLRCSGCEQAYYCCEEHQRLHWKQGHKKTCLKEEKTQEESLEAEMRRQVGELNLEGKEKERVAKALNDLFKKANEAVDDV